MNCHSPTPGNRPLHLAAPPKTPEKDTAPLYQRVADRIANRIYDGHWRPGESIPNEFALADEFSVSQGTVRKAMSVVEEAGLVDRQQGRGTFVRKLSEERSYYHFFRLAKPHGDRVVPEPLSEKLSTRKATKEEKDTFKLSGNQSVVVIERVRVIDGIKATREQVVVPEQLFKGLSTEQQPLPNSLYPFYHQRFGIFVLRADEYIAATLADKSVANDLDIDIGTPTLEVHRTGFDLKERVVEMRVSQFRADVFQYQINLN